MVRPPRLSDSEKDHYTVAESENILVINGITQVLNYLGSANGNSTAFAKYLALGNGDLAMVDISDTSLVNEILRITVTQTAISSTQMDLSVFNALSGSAVPITEAGLSGGNATGTPGSGILVTHSPLEYTQPSSSSVKYGGVAYDYLLSYI